MGSAGASGEITPERTARHSESTERGHGRDIPLRLSIYLRTPHTPTCPQLSLSQLSRHHSPVITLPSALRALIISSHPLTAPLKKEFQNSVRAVHIHMRSRHTGVSRRAIPSISLCFAESREKDKKMLKMQVRVCVCVMTVMQAKLSSFQCRNVTCARGRSPWVLSLVFTCCLVRMSRWKWLYKFLYPQCCDVGWSVL